jgi:hypothetical protein
VLLALSSGAAAVAMMSGCSSDDKATEPSGSSTPASSVMAPATTSPPSVAPSSSAASEAPASVAPTTGMSGAGPSQTESGGASASPPPVVRSPSPPTGDNLPGENGGPGGRPGTAGDDN